MTPKEKAQSLVDKYMPLVTRWDCYNDVPLEREDKLPDAKQCAIIAVNEILEVLGGAGVYSFADLKITTYYEEVLQEINAL